MWIGRWRTATTWSEIGSPAADISVGYALLLAVQLKLDERFSPAIRAYWERLKARPAFKAAKVAQKQDLSEALSS